MCIEITGEDFLTIHHELGHNFYQRAYNKQPPSFRDSANDGFHEAIGDTIALSITPEYLVKLGLLDQAPDTSKDIGLLLHKALEKIAFLPFGLVIDQWRWKVFSGEIPPEKYNETWWELRLKYQGIAPPVRRSEADFDPGAKYHVAANVPYMRYFLADILQFQFHRALAQAAGCTGPLNRCSIYGNKEAGRTPERHAGNGPEPSLAGRPGKDRRHAPDGRHRHPRLLRAAAEVAGRAEPGQARGLVVESTIRAATVRERSYIPAFAYRPRIHSTNLAGASMVERRDCRTSAQSSNLPDCLISASVVGGSSRSPYARSTTADFGFFGSSRPSESTLAIPTTAETPPL